jgi:transcription antitermination factor NusG
MEKEILELFGSLEEKHPEKWRVIYTKPRHEKKLAKYSMEKGVSYYLPLVESVRSYADRKISFWKPLFPSYIFVRCDLIQKHILQISGHVKMFIPVPNEQELIHDLYQIYLTLKTGEEILSHPYLESGMKVKITDGPFTGIYGYVEDASKKDIVILQIQILQKAVSVKVKSSFVQMLKKD